MSDLIKVCLGIAVNASTMSSRRGTKFLIENVARIEHPRFAAIATVSFGSVVIDLAVAVHRDEKMNDVLSLRELGCVKRDPLKRGWHPLDSDVTREAVLNDIVQRLLSSTLGAALDELSLRRTISVRRPKFRETS